MRFGGIVLAALLTLGACSSDPEPKEPKPTATSATHTATPPTMPAQAKEDTPEGAAAFVKHYIELVNYAANTGDSEPMAAASQACKPCQSFGDAFSEEPTDGERFAGKLWKPTKLTVGSTRDPLTVRAELLVQEGRKRNPYTFNFLLTTDSPFRVRSISMVAES